MLQFVVDHGDPLGALEDCGVQLDMLTDLLCQGGQGGIDLSEMGSAGLADLLRAVSRAVNASVGIIRPVYRAGLEIIERGADPVAEETSDDLRSQRQEMLARLLAEGADTSEILANRATAVGGADTLLGAPRLTEPRPRPRSQRAA